jgi:formyltetrahydrofolate synthetase
MLDHEQARNHKVMLPLIGEHLAGPLTVNNWHVVSLVDFNKNISLTECDVEKLNNLNKKNGVEHNSEEAQKTFGKGALSLSFDLVKKFISYYGHVFNQ